MGNVQLDDCALERLEAGLGYRFKDRSLLAQALVHRSLVNEADLADTDCNERLEFLGDAALDLVIAELVYRRYPDQDEGRLTRARASLVNLTALARGGAALEIDKCVQLGRGQDSIGMRKRPSVLGRTLEAVLGAIFLDQGIEALREVADTTLIRKIDSYGWERLARDFKSQLQESLQADKRGTPVYETVSVQGPGHAQVFTMAVCVGGSLLASGEGSSKQRAEQAAARAALMTMKPVGDAINAHGVASAVDRLQACLGVKFNDRLLLEQALLHRSFVNEAGLKSLESNERLEFLGDEVHDLIVAEFLYRKYPGRAEGWLSRARASLVNLESQGKTGAALGLGEFIRLGRGAELDGARKRVSVLGRTFEAVLGALYLDQGLAAIRELLYPITTRELERHGAEGPPQDFKSQLQHHLHAERGTSPKYKLVSVQGPDDHRVYTVSVQVGDTLLASGKGPRKRWAEQAAARAALTAILDGEGTTDVPAAD